MAADENRSDETPEADALEQDQEVEPTEDAHVDDGMEVPEADALEQARVVPTDDEPIPED